MDWPKKLAHILAREPCVAVTLNLILGSAPRESGSRLLVTANEVYGSIGGGNLEYTAIGEAREMLGGRLLPRQFSKKFGLGPALNQCCGGAVTLNFELLVSHPPWLSSLVVSQEKKRAAVLALEISAKEPRRFLLEFSLSSPPGFPDDVVQAARKLLESSRTGAAGKGSAESMAELETEHGTWWLERLERRSQPLYLFGAGHVGQEVARLLERLPFEVAWIDSRKEYFPDQTGENIHEICTGDPAREVAAAPENTVFVVMTHSHELDEHICYEVLRKGGFAWLGLIGSETKRKRFVQRLNRRGIDQEKLARLVCPIGLNGIRGKQPATIALSLVAQLMQEQSMHNQSEAS